MVSQQSTTLPLDFTHLLPKFKYGNKQTCFVHPTQDIDSITNNLLNDKENFSKFLFILQLSGLSKKFMDKNGFTLAVVPNKYLQDICTLQLSRFDAYYIILKHVINNSIRPFDIGGDTLWISNGHNSLFNLNKSYWKNSKIIGTKQCSNGYIYIIDKLVD